MTGKAFSRTSHLASWLLNSCKAAGQGLWLCVFPDQKGYAYYGRQKSSSDGVGDGRAGRT